MDDLAEFKQTYFQECEELLADLEGQLTALQEGETPDEILHAAFRAIHSIKGGAGAFGFDQLVSFAHVFETVLDQMREHKLDTSPANVALMIRANDILSDLVAAAQADTPLAADFGQDVLASLNEVAGLTGAAGGSDDDDDDFDDLDFNPVRVDDDEATAKPADEGDTAAPDPTRLVKISFKPQSAMFLRANEPLLIMRELKTLGSLVVNADLDRLPHLEELEPESAHLEWRLELETAAPKSAIDEVFEFILDDCDLVIEDTGPGPAAAPPAAKEAAAEPEATKDGGRNDAPPPAKAGKDAPPPPPPPQDPAGTDPRKPPEKKAPATIRVDLERIDRLVNMVGELVITQAMISEQAGRLSVDQHAALLHGVETLALQMRELQESVMAIRAQPVKSVFSRMTRLVRELSAMLGKDARLVITGEHTEVDKTVIEELADPLTHMIRNSMDHGLESGDDREASGKAREGLIHLSAEHRSGRIVIAISDDGRGINRPKVLEKAIARGLIPADAKPSEDEIDNMILLPGFSTADQVSNVSGRGVGMDVVVRKIQNMGGRVGISSTPGQGSRFTLTLPLTLAVLDGMIVRVGEDSYIIPITSIVESLRPTPEEIHQVAGGGEVLSIRGDYITLVHLSRLFANPRAVKKASDGLVVVVETGAAGRIGIVVDELLGQQQVVIKSLEANYQRVNGVAGATILGNGMVAMILDVDGIRAMALQHTPEASGNSLYQQKEMH
jgi:two-component system chemotaxis sensor kinase CheA